MGKTYRTPSSCWSLIFRRIIQQLETDPKINAVIGKGNIRSWKGEESDSQAFQPNDKTPSLRLTPQPKGVDWYDPSSQSGTLVILVEIACQSLCIDDPIDLYDMLVTSLSPSGRALTSGVDFSQDLINPPLYAETGEIVFADPAFDPKPAAEPVGYMYAFGRCWLRVIRQNTVLD